MKKIIRILCIVLTAGLLTTIITTSAWGDELTDAKNKRSEIQQQLKDSEARLEKLKEDVAAARQEVEKIDAEIAEVQNIINDYQAQSDTKQIEIDALQVQIDEKQAEIDRQYNNMKLRIKFLYENMENSYVEALLTSETFADALNKMQYLMELNNYDRQARNKLIALQNDIKADQDVLKQQQAEIEELKGAQEEQKAVLDEILDVKAVALGDIENEEEIARQENEYLEEMLQEVNDEIKSIAASYDITTGGYVPTEGSFLWPLPEPYGPGWISSPYGYRMDPFGGGFTSFHNGIDIGAPGGIPIFAVDDGQVVISADGWNGGCGNYTVIYHGGGLYTEYMHQSARNVYVGQFVSQGDVIGYVGTTGSSTGCHLHFGVVSSDHGFDYTQRIDPTPYLGIY